MTRPLIHPRPLAPHHVVFDWQRLNDVRFDPDMRPAADVHRLRTLASTPFHPNAILASRYLTLPHPHFPVSSFFTQRRLRTLSVEQLDILAAYHAAATQAAHNNWLFILYVHLMESAAGRLPFRLRTADRRSVADYPHSEAAADLARRMHYPDLPSLLFANPDFTLAQTSTGDVVLEAAGIPVYRQFDVATLHQRCRAADPHTTPEHRHDFLKLPVSAVPHLARLVEATLTEPAGHRHLTVTWRRDTLHEMIEQTVFIAGADQHRYVADDAFIASIRRNAARFFDDRRDTFDTMARAADRRYQQAASVLTSIPEASGAFPLMPFIRRAFQNGHSRAANPPPGLTARQYEAVLSYLKVRQTLNRDRWMLAVNDVVRSQPTRPDPYPMPSLVALYHHQSLGNKDLADLIENGPAFVLSRADSPAGPVVRLETGPLYKPPQHGGEFPFAEVPVDDKHRYDTAVRKPFTLTIDWPLDTLKRDTPGRAKP